jgi:hypothetical protein
VQRRLAIAVAIEWETQFAMKLKCGKFRRRENNAHLWI